MNPTTDVQTFDIAINTEATDRTLGLITFDIHQLQPIGTDQAVAGQFGLIGAMVWVAGKNAANDKDFSIDSEGIQFYRDAHSLLSERLPDIETFHFTETPPDIMNDDTALSRHIRDIRLNGSKKLTQEEVISFCNKHRLDYVLFSRHWGGEYAVDNSLFMSSQWNIYDSAGKIKASVFTRSKNEQISPDSMDQEALSQALLALYAENMEKFIVVLNTGKP
jgi:hypothetical protein